MSLGAEESFLNVLALSRTHGHRHNKRGNVGWADGSVTGLEARGLVLGIESNQEYEEVRASLEHGSAVVLYTDGVIEARRDGELYGEARLDRLLGERRDLPAGELARCVLDDCRAFARGELADYCAVVVVKRT